MQLTPAQLLNGYANGIFPMARSADDPALSWFDPPMRGVLPVGGVHASRSLLRSLKKEPWAANLNHDFAGVIDACAARKDTWINAELRVLYIALHQAGFAHSITVTYNDQFAGAIFGISLGSAFFGESMVSWRSNGSKLGLLWMSMHLARCRFTLFDTQYLTPHLARMGGFEIPRAEYRHRLTQAIAQKSDLTAQPLPDANQVWQEITQMS